VKFVLVEEQEFFCQDNFSNLFQRRDILKKLVREDEENRVVHGRVSGRWF
jgi:hypothetical protein